MDNIRTTIIRNDATILSFDSDSWDAARLEAIRLADDPWHKITNSDAPVFMSDTRHSPARMQRHTVRSIRQDNERDKLSAAVQNLADWIDQHLRKNGDSTIVQLAKALGRSEFEIEEGLTRLGHQGRTSRVGARYYRARA